MIRFGSRLDVYLPEGIPPLVAVGQTVDRWRNRAGRSAWCRRCAGIPGGLIPPGAALDAVISPPGSLFRIGLSATSARTPVSASIVMMIANTGNQLPALSYISAATGPPRPIRHPAPYTESRNWWSRILVPKVSVSVEGNSEKISPQPKNTTPTAGRTATRCRASEPWQRTAHGFHEEGDRHRVLAADVIRYPAEERPRQTIGDAIDRQRQRQCGETEDQ